MYAVVDLPSLRYHWFKLPTLPAKSSSFITVSTKLDQVLWLASDATKYEVHLTTRAGDHLVATLPNQINGICGPWGSSSGAYTRSGDHLFVLTQPHAEALNSLVVLQGQTPVLSLIPSAAGWGLEANPTMAVWSPTAETMFYLRGGDVWRWSPDSKPQRFLARTSWSYPTIAPDGKHLAYELSGNVYLVDLGHAGSPSPKLIGKDRIGPVFLQTRPSCGRRSRLGAPVLNPGISSTTSPAAPRRRASSTTSLASGRPQARMVTRPALCRLRQRTAWVEISRPT